MNRGFSLYLDLLRFGAAVAVAVTHLAYTELSGGQLAAWRLVGNDAVMVFFVLSGLVIAHVATTKETALRDYAASRLARLWSVAVPALAITLALDLWGKSVNPAAYAEWWFQGDQPVLRLAAAASFTNELWFASIRPFSNGPYWSLGYEFWFYAIFAGLAYFRGRKRIALAGGMAVVAGPKIMLLFPVWWLGVWAYDRIRRAPPSPAAGWVLFAGSVAAYALLRWYGVPTQLLAATADMLGQDFVNERLRFSNEFLASHLIGPLVVANFIGAHALAGQLERMLAPAARLIRWAAQSTFALYLLHYPLLRFIGATVPYDRLSAVHVALVLAGVIAVILTIGPAIERTKAGWRRAILAAMERGRRHSPSA